MERWLDLEYACYLIEKIDGISYKLICDGSVWTVRGFKSGKLTNYLSESGWFSINSDEMGQFKSMDEALAVYDKWVLFSTSQEQYLEFIKDTIFKNTKGNK